MKRILLCLFAVVLPLLASAQISKNQTIWTGSVHGKFNQHKFGTIRNPIIDLGAEASAAYFVRDGLAVGLGVSGSWVDNYRTFEEARGLYEQNWWSRSGAAMPFVRKYWKFAPVIVYAGGGVRVSGDKDVNRHQVQYTILQESRSRSFLVRPQTQLGAILPLSKRLGLDISAQSDLFPISFNTLQLGLVVLSGAEPVQTDTGEGFTSPLTRGRWVASGTFSTGLRYFGNGSSNGPRPNTSISMAAGTFVQDRLLVGAEVYARFEGAVWDSPIIGYSGRNPVLVGIRPYIKKYVGSARLAPYIQGSLAYDRIMAGSRPTNTFYAGGNIGLAYVLG